MISLETLAKKIEEKLTNTEFKFYITTDTGKLKRSERVGNEVINYVNGLMTSGMSEVTNLVSGSENKLTYATQTATLRFILSLSNEEEDKFYLDDGRIVNNVAEIGTAKVVQTRFGNITKINNLRALLNNTFQGVVVEDMPEKDEQGNVLKTYSVTTVYQFVETGNREQNPLLGNSFSYTLNIYYSFIENGLNTRSMVFYLDGVPIPYQSNTLERNSIMDANVYADTQDGTTESVATQSTLNISFELPAIANNTVTNTILSYVLDGELNQAHILKLALNGEDKYYLVAISGSRLSGETIKNIGQSLTFVPVRKNYNLLKFSKNLWIYSADSNNYSYFIGDKVFVFGKTKGFVVSPKVKDYGDKIVSAKGLFGTIGLSLLQEGG